MIPVQLSSFLDESGTSDDPNILIVAVAGPVIPIESWDRTADDWRRVLGEFDVPAMHMKDFAHSSGHFETWKGDEPRRRAFLNRLFTVLDRDVSVYIGAAMALEVWREQPGLHGLALDPYHGCLRLCYRIAAEYAATLPGLQRVAVVVSEGAFNHDAYGLFEAVKTTAEHRQHLGLMALSDPLEIVQLQAADMVAWELGKHLTTQAQGKHCVRWPMQKILDKSGETYLKTIIWKHSGQLPGSAVKDVDSPLDAGIKGKGRDA